MASSTPPNHSHQSTSDDGKSPLFNFNFLKFRTEKKTQDGKPVKRPGPKPGTKPALTGRRERNRQAQRTHRERKELYIKAIEDEILRMKEVCSNMSRDKARLAEENRQVKAENHQLRDLLSQNGIDAGDVVVSGGGSGDNHFLDDDLMYAVSSSAGVTGSPAAGASVGNMTGGAPSPYHNSTTPVYTSAGHGGQYQRAESGTGVQPDSGALDYDQAGIDFVLVLEKPCMAAHIPWLLPLERNNTQVGGHSEEPCGHALMASCPPEPFLVAGSDYANAIGAEQQPTWELTKGDLGTLLGLSTNLNLDGQITPVMAWGMVVGHPRLGELSKEDFGWLTEELGRKAKCYGFGAVMEEFEVRDALETILSTKVAAPGTAY